MMTKEKIELLFCGQVFAFDLCHRTIAMGAAGEIDYWWMAIPGLRTSGGGRNVHACIDMWWAHTLAAKLTDPADREDAAVNLALAELYRHIASDRSPQKVFADAFLGRSAGSRRRTASRRGMNAQFEYEDDGELDDRSFVLPDVEWKRLRAMCRSRDVDAISGEIASLYVGQLPPDGEKPAYKKACSHWMACALDALSHGRDELSKFVADDLVTWIRSYRRRGALIRPRLFINMVSYEAKVSFFTCYASAWRQLIPWLMQHRGLSATSARFMGLWHNQNELQRCRDAFWGHIFAQHPLSERVMTQMQHRCAVGAWLQAAQTDPIDGTNAKRNEYWDLVATTLAAGHEYVHLRDQANAARRKGRTTARLSVPEAAVGARKHPCGAVR